MGMQSSGMIGMKLAMESPRGCNLREDLLFTLIPNVKTLIPNDKALIPNVTTLIPNDKALIPNDKTLRSYRQRKKSSDTKC